MLLDLSNQVSRCAEIEASHRVQLVIDIIIITISIIIIITLIIIIIPSLLLVP
jgi:hypothetical protein